MGGKPQSIQIHTYSGWMTPKIARIPNLLSYTTKYMMASRPEKKKYKRRRSISLSESFTLVGFWQRLEGGLCVWLSNSEWVSFVCVCVCSFFVVLLEGVGRSSFFLQGSGEFARFLAGLSSLPIRRQPQSKPLLAAAVSSCPYSEARSSWQPAGSVTATLGRRFHPFCGAKK
jgi:hypothetical protein